MGVPEAGEAVTVTDMRAVRVADGAIKIDGRLDDWSCVPETSEYRVTSADAAHQTAWPQRGTWTGPYDQSFTVMAAEPDLVVSCVDVAVTFT